MSNTPSGTRKIPKLLKYLFKIIEQIKDAAAQPAACFCTTCRAHLASLFNVILVSNYGSLCDRTVRPGWTDKENFGSIIEEKSSSVSRAKKSSAGSKVYRRPSQIIMWRFLP